jgi:hypothetical protein
VTYCDVLTHSLYNEGDELGVAVGRLVAVGAMVGVAVGSGVAVAADIAVSLGGRRVPLAGPAQPMSNVTTTARCTSDTVSSVCASKLFIDEPS